MRVFILINILFAIYSTPSQSATLADLYGTGKIPEYCQQVGQMEGNESVIQTKLFSLYRSDLSWVVRRINEEKRIGDSAAFEKIQILEGRKNILLRNYRSLVAKVSRAKRDIRNPRLKAIYKLSLYCHKYNRLKVAKTRIIVEEARYKIRWSSLYKRESERFRAGKRHFDMRWNQLTR